MTASMTSLPHLAPPLHATRRSPELATFGPHVDKVMAALGHPSMPWQQHVNAVANEVLPDGSWRYKTVILTVPRQSGKSTCVWANLVFRAMTVRDFRGWYTAQTGQAARDMWYEGKRQLDQSMPGRWGFRLSNGEETARWDPTQGFIRSFPPTPDSLHGKQSDLVCLDEVFSYTLERGSEITQAVVPTQATRGGRSQLWIVSTAGDENSLWMKSWIDKGRASLDDPDTTIAHFEWAANDDVDILDPETWHTFHPAMGHTIGREQIQTALEQMGESEFSRAYGNRWPTISESWRGAWATLDNEPIPPGVPVFVGVDSPTNHGHGALVAAGRLPDGRVAIEVIDYHHGVDWIADRLRALAARNELTFTIHGTGPLAHLVDELRADVLPLEVYTQSQYAEAVSYFQTTAVARGFTHRHDPRLAVAVANVQDTNAERPVWRRKDAKAADISPLVAAAMAAYLAGKPDLSVQVF